jgi:hypothetical protein
VLDIDYLLNSEFELLANVNKCVTCECIAKCLFQLY